MLEILRFPDLPEHVDPEERFRIRMVRRLSVVTPVVVSLALLVRNLIQPLDRVQGLSTLVVLGILVASALIVLKGRSARPGAMVYLFGCWLLIVLAALHFGGIRTPGIFLIVLLPIFGATLLGASNLLPLTLLALVTLIWIAWLDAIGKLPPLGIAGGGQIGLYASTIGFLTLLSAWVASSYERARKDAEERLLQSSRSLEMGVLSDGISHEINNPMTAILTGLYVLEREIPAGQGRPPRVDAVLRQMRTAADRVNGVTTLLHDLARDGEDFKKTAGVPVGAVVTDALALSKERLSAAGVRMDVVEPLSPAKVVADKGQLVRVLIELMNNSAEAVATQPEKWIRISTRPSQGAVEIAVEDSGPGLSPELKKRLFTPFLTTKRPGKGLGLALAVSARAIQAQGGRLYLDESAERTTFVVSLPVSGGH
jgi:signal transduction histidine kinase